MERNLTWEGAPNLQCASNIRFPHKSCVQHVSGSRRGVHGRKLDIEGDLYHALDQFLGQMGKFSTNRKGLKKIALSDAVEEKTRRQR